MKYKGFIYFCLMLLFLPLLTLTESSIQANTVQWDTSLKKDTIMRWRVIYTNGNPQLGSQNISLNSTIEIRFTNDPSNLFSDLYNGEIPSWYSILIDNNVIDKESLDQIEKDIITGLIWPIEINWDNGSTTSLSEFIYKYNPTFGNASYQSCDEGYLGVKWADYNQRNVCYLYISNTTGIAYQFDKRTGNDGFGGIIEFEESTTTEEEEDYPTKIEWGSNIQKGTILAWNVTKYQPVQGNEFKIGTSSLQLGTVLQMGFIKNPPTNPASFFDPEGPPSWLELFLDGTKIDLNTIGDEGEMLQFLVLPINYQFDNGTVLHLIDFVSRINEDDQFTNFTVDEDTQFINASWVEEWEDEGIQNSNAFEIVWRKSTGVILKLASVSTEGNMTLSYFEKAANVDQSGTTKTVDDEYSVSLEYPFPSFQLIPALVFLAIAVIVKKKRK